MFHSAPIAHRSFKSQVRLRGEALENRYMLSHPAVAAVNVAGTAWTSNFISHLQSAGLGSGGYAIPVGSSAQLQTLPWTNINQIRIRFSENVVIASSDLSVSGVNQTAYTFSNFSYDSGTFTATWTLTNPIAKDKLMIDLDADGMAPVKSVATGEVLDGAWTNCQSTYNSGNGQGGTDFQFRFNVLPGDVNGNTSTNTIDMSMVISQVGKNAGDAGYNIRYDVDGSGGITSADTSAVQSKIVSLLPSGNPVGMTDDAPTTSGIADLSVATSVTDQVLDLTDFFADAETAADQLTYSIVQNTNPSLFDTLNINSSGELDLNFAGSVAGSASLTIRATDPSGLIVQTSMIVHRSAAPSIGNFCCINEISDYWTLTGSVIDFDDDVEGFIVTFGGVFEPYQLFAIVRADGVFSITVDLENLETGIATAKTMDPNGVRSNVAEDWICG
jgi:hypothetical protein